MTATTQHPARPRRHRRPAQPLDLAAACQRVLARTPDPALREALESVASIVRRAERGRGQR